MLPLTYYSICLLLSLVILYGIFLMSKVNTAVRGNLLSCLATALAIILTIKYYNVFSDLFVVYLTLIGLGIGTLIGLVLSKKVKMIQMPELVASLNGVGGAASALVGGSALFFSSTDFELITSIIALIIGTVTFTGSLVAAGKLSKMIDGRPVIWNGQQIQINLLIALLVIITISTITIAPSMIVVVVIATLLSGLLGLAFTLRVGGADMPITISLLNSLSGVAGAIAGMAIGDILLVSVGGIVGASGLLLTQIMCRSMNSSLGKILLGKTSIASTGKKLKAGVSDLSNTVSKIEEINDGSNELKLSNSKILSSAKKVIIVPGYGMALAQAQHLVKQLSDDLEANGAEVKYAIHPVAGRMPGHMNVLLCEADVPYEKLYELDVINEEFSECDACIVIGANDVMNPAAREAEGTPIYGMPVLDVDKAKHIFICNYDLKPGYAGVENPLYKRNSGVSLLLGDARETLNNLLSELKIEKMKENQTHQTRNRELSADLTTESLSKAKKVIIVPGYGMALAQAQHLVKQLSDHLEVNGAEVKYAIHPVAGRMPGHMNVLLCEADVPYEKLYEMDVINEEFSECDVCIVVGANDVMNPAAREAEGTPIYGMPVLDVDKAKHIIICNYDLKPGYAGVENPLYKRDSGVSLLLGDASETLNNLLNELKMEKVKKDKVDQTNTNMNTEIDADLSMKALGEAKKVIIVPGYGMALAQAQHLVKQLSDHLERNGAEVKYAIHPVAGRMPGHMNVLLCEADVPYEKLYELDVINEEFNECDVCIVIGANDVMNPAAREAEGTPIYGMPVLNVDKAMHIIICNFDLKPGYAGVENPLYKRKNGVSLLLGDAGESLQTIINNLEIRKVKEVKEVKEIKDLKKVKEVKKAKQSKKTVNF